MAGLRDYTIVYTPLVPTARDQVFEHGSAKNTTNEVYTVPTDKILMLTSIQVACLNQDASYAEGYMTIRDGDDSEEHRWWLALTDKGFVTIVLSFPDPIEIAEGWDFAVYSSAADFTTLGGITGYLV